MKIPLIFFRYTYTTNFPHPSHWSQLVQWLEVGPEGGGVSVRERREEERRGKERREELLREEERKGKERKGKERKGNEKEKEGTSNGEEW